MNACLFAAAIAVTNALVTLPPVVVEASRLDLEESQAPSAVHLIGREEIESSGVNDFAALLQRNAPELHLSSTGAGNPALAQVSMRGYGENGFGRVLVLVDGEKLNNPDLMGPNLGRIALGGISRIEVLGGSHCVQHGDGASAGVINVITEPEAYEQRGYAEMHGGDYGRLGAAAGWRGGFAAEGVKYWADVAYDHSDGCRGNSGYDLWNAIAGVKKEWENGTWLKFSGFYSDSDFRTPGALSRDELLSDRRATNTPKDWYWRATYGFGTVFNLQLNEENALKFAGNFSSRHVTGHAENSGWGYIEHNRHEVYSWRGAVDWINTAEIFGFENRFDLGLEYRYDRLEGIGESSYSGALSREFPNYDRALLDVIIADQFRFNDYFALEIGGRISRAWTWNNLCNPCGRRDCAWAFDIALVANPVAGGKLYAKWSHFFRYAALDEVPWGLNPTSLAYERQGMLAPEHGHTTEIGFNWQATDEFRCGGDVYATFLNDEIFYDAINGANVNYDGRTFRGGADLFAAWEREKCAGFRLAVNWTKAAFDGGEFGRKTIPMVPSATVSANGRVWIGDDVWIFGGYRYQAWMYSISDFNNEFRAIDGYGIFHIGATWKPSAPEWLDGVSFTVAVDNLMDKNYCNYVTYGANYYPAAGRTLTVTIRYEF